MAKDPTLEHFRRPELFLSELLTKSARGELLEKRDNIAIWKRAVVLAVDVNGGLLENPNATGSVKHVIGPQTVNIPAKEGPENPRNSIKARIISNAGDEFSSDDEVNVFWPMFPEHISIPIKPGEHVYVTFEDVDSQHGLWFGKVPGHSNVNFFDGNDSFKQDEFLASNFPDDPGEPGDGFVDGNIVASGRKIPTKPIAGTFPDDPSND